MQIRRRRKHVQFRLKHLVIATTVIAIVIQPTALLVVRMIDYFHVPEMQTVTVPDGGTVLIGGMRFRPGVYRGPAEPPRTVSSANNLMLMVTPRIIIQEEEETLYLPTQ